MCLRVRHRGIGLDRAPHARRIRTGCHIIAFSSRCIPFRVMLACMLVWVWRWTQLGALSRAIDNETKGGEREGGEGQSGLLIRG
jgi:hypothetical protein